MKIIILATQVLLDDDAFRASHPNVSFPAVLSAEVLLSFGAAAVVSMIAPTPGALQTIALGAPALDETTGLWTQQWTTSDITDPEVIAAHHAAEEKALVKACIDQVQRTLDAVAQARGYDDIKSAALRAGYPGPFHDEGVEFAVWMDECWAECYRIMAEVKAGTRPMITLSELIEEMPAAPVLA